MKQCALKACPMVGFELRSTLGSHKPRQASVLADIAVECLYCMAPRTPGDGETEAVETPPRGKTEGRTQRNGQGISTGVMSVGNPA